MENKATAKMKVTTLGRNPQRGIARLYKNPARMFEAVVVCNGAWNMPPAPRRRVRGVDRRRTASEELRPLQGSRGGGFYRGVQLESGARSKYPSAEEWRRGQFVNASGKNVTGM